MSSSHYSKSVHSARSHRDSDIESWGTAYSDSRTPTPTHTSSNYAQPSGAYSHRSNPSYPSPSYGPSSPFGGFSASLASYPQTPGTPYLGSVPLPQQYVNTTAPQTPYLSTIPLPGDGTLNPLLSYPPKAVFNVTYPCSSIAFRDGLSSNDVALYPPVQSIVLGLSFVCAGKRISVQASSSRGLTVHDVFVALSNLLLSTPTTYDVANIQPDVYARGKLLQSARRRNNGYPHLRWTDLLGERVYFGGLANIGNGVYEVGFVSAPLA
ncbi:uncharacterized protein C8R40DRAFT_1073628 [Lentinula edodes]|uniref:uncharacterized protein n=1 Tax=Lentinula edodes TaxID=5353 RepID=UPI001E8D5D54|nr:uncharacterized protein C8R40DRAFT_1073628 [Lentinula edodes]KAH7869990.1 hypothetical protein C8R40DRAFT_1073628 [Lentinula edodes]